MKLIDIIGKIPKTVTGFVVVLAGAAVNYIPLVGPIASPYICGAGVAIMTGGIIAKAVNVYKGKDPFANERSIINKYITKNGGKDESY